MNKAKLRGIEQKVVDRNSTRLFIIEDERGRYIMLPNNELLRTCLTRQGVAFTPDSTKLKVDLTAQEIGIDESGGLSIEGYPETFKVELIRLTRG